MKSNDLKKKKKVCSISLASGCSSVVDGPETLCVRSWSSEIFKNRIKVICLMSSLEAWTSVAGSRKDFSTFREKYRKQKYLTVIHPLGLDVLP